MTNKFKTLLKTTAAVATLMVGSQTWGAFWTSDDNTELTTTDLTISSTYAAVIPNGTCFSSGGYCYPWGCYRY